MENENKKKRIVMIVVAAIILVAAAVIFLYFRLQIRATTMRVLRMEGVVSLEDDGKEKTIRENIRLNSGNALSTAVKSLVSIGLDDTKVVTLDELSRAIFEQKGRKLDLNLTDGSLFFEVSKPLEDEETFDIATSTMVVGIRGTSGWVSVEGEHESLIVSDGKVHVIGTNPVTGEKKEIDVNAGQKIETFLYNDRSVDSIMFTVTEITERDLPEFMLERLRENPVLLDKVCNETGWDKPWILGQKDETAENIPVEKIEPEKTSDSDSEEEPEVEEPVEEPVVEQPATQKTAEEKKPAVDDTEDQIKKLLAMLTPTATPVPQWVNNEPAPIEDPYGEDDDEDNNDSSSNSATATPAPTATQAAAPSPTAAPTSTPTATPSPTPAPTSGGWTQTGTNSPEIILGGVTKGYISQGNNKDTLVIYGNENVVLPLTLTNSTSGDKTFSSFEDFNWTYCGMGNQNVNPPISSGDFSVTDNNLGSITKTGVPDPNGGTTMVLRAKKLDGTTQDFDLSSLSQATAFLSSP